MLLIQPLGRTMVVLSYKDMLDHESIQRPYGISFRTCIYTVGANKSRNESYILGVMRHKAYCPF